MVARVWKVGFVNEVVKLELCECLSGHAEARMNGIKTSIRFIKMSCVINSNKNSNVVSDRLTGKVGRTSIFIYENTISKNLLLSAFHGMDQLHISVSNPSSAGELNPRIDLVLLYVTR